MYKLAIFDLDGTLLDTLNDLAAACNRALRLSGFPEHPVDAYRYFVGNGVKNLVLRALPENRRDDAAFSQALELFRSYYADHAQDLTSPYPGIVDAIRSLKQAGVTLAVLSNKPDAYTRILVEQYFPGQFALAYGQREGVPIKPDPAAVEEILDHFGAERRDCVYIGDTATDIETGRNAGLETIGVAWGFRTKEELENAGASYVIDNSSQLLEIIVDNR